MSSRKDFPVTISDETYLLRFNYDALTYIEDVTGKPFAEFLESLKSLKSIKLLLTAGLKRNHPNLSSADVSDLLDGCDGIKDLVALLLEAVTNYFSKGKSANDEPAKKKDSSASLTAG